MTTTTPTRARIGPAILFLLGSLAYLAILRGYGFQLEDEGTLLMQLDRVLRGQVPYVDFHTGYTPAFFYGGAEILRLLGRSVLGVRSVLMLVNAASATALYVLGRRMVGSWMAALPPLLWLALVPTYPGDFAAFNIPYPTWPATLAWLVIVFCVLRWERTDEPVMLAITGTAVAVLLAVRPNSGAFALAASTWVVCALARREGLIDNVAAIAAAAFMALGVWFTLDCRVAGTDAAVHLLPVMVISVFYAGPFATTLARRSGLRASVALAILALAFVIPTAAWMLPFRLALGTETFLREVLLIGADYATLYYKAHPPPEVYAALIVAGVLGVAATGHLVRRRLVSPWLPLGAAAAAAVVVAAVAVRSAVMPEGVRASLVFQVENAVFWLVPLANYGAVALLLHSALARQGLHGKRTFAVVTAFAVAMYLQLYPRSDFMHAITAAPLSLLVGVVLLDRVVTWWEQGSWTASIDGRLVMRTILAAGAAIVLAARFSLTLPGPLQSLWAAPGEDAARRAEVLPVRTEPGAEDEIEAFQRTALFVRDHTAPGEAVWTFPATSGVLFAADRTSPLPHDYWFPGRPDHAAEADMLARLREHLPRYLVTINDGWTFFTGSPAYFEQARELVTGRYRLAARLGRFDVLARNDVEPAAEVEVFQPVGTQAAAIEPQLARRRQAARRWMAALTPQEAAAATLPPDTRSAVLLLRALRDGGDIRAAGWLIAGWRSSDGRVRHEAVSDMPLLVLQLELRRLRWANDFSAAEYVPFLQPYESAARQMLGDPQASEFAKAILSLLAPAG